MQTERCARIKVASRDAATWIATVVPYAKLHDARAVCARAREIEIDVSAKLPTDEAILLQALRSR